MKNRNRKSPKVLLLICVFLLGAIFPTTSNSQSSLTIEECYKLAKENYPLIKQTTLIEKTSEFSVANASRMVWPQLAINGQATYQSDVPELPIYAPGSSGLSKDQYKIYGEINQPLTDLFTIKQQKDLIKANADSESQQITVELYKLNERINQLYFGILLIDAQIEQALLLKQELQSGLKKMNATVDNGISLKSNALVLEAELLKASQHIIELKANKNGYNAVLSLFINKPLDENIKLQLPVTQNISEAINRPELKLFKTQKSSFDVQQKIISNKNIPKLGLFFQEGYGRPALNFLNDEFEFYYIGGIRLNWNLSGNYTSRKEKQILQFRQSMVDIQKETFLLNTTMTLKLQSVEITKLQELIETDIKIISLREKIKSTANNQLENGTITAIDYLTYINAEDQAKQNLVIHQVQLVMSQYNYRTTSGN